MKLPIDEPRKETLSPKKKIIEPIKNKTYAPKENLTDVKPSTALSKSNDLIQLTDVSELDARLKELTDRRDGVWTCNFCGKTAQRKRDLHWHIESHFENLSLPCGHCEKTFRSKRSLETHIKTL